MKKLTAALCILSVSLIFSCKSSKNDDVACTQEYKILNISITDSASHPVHLSNYYVKKVATGEMIDFSMEDPYYDSINRIQGYYCLFTDGKMGMTAKSGTEFEFHGSLNSVEIVNEKYLIGNDGCHVRLISGQAVIVIAK
jgi:hypothetical protein